MEKFILVTSSNQVIGHENGELRVYKDIDKVHKYDRMGDAMKDAIHINSIMGKPCIKCVSVYE